MALFDKYRSLGIDLWRFIRRKRQAQLCSSITTRAEVITWRKSTIRDAASEAKLWNLFKTWWNSLIKFQTCSPQSRLFSALSISSVHNRYKNFDVSPAHVQLGICTLRQPNLVQTTKIVSGNRLHVLKLRRGGKSRDGYIDSCIIPK